MSRIRYRGLARNAGHHQFVVAVMNMKRALVSTKSSRMTICGPTRTSNRR